MKKVTLAELTLSLESGSRPKGGIKDILSGIPSIGAEHLTDDGSFDFSKLKLVPETFFNSMKKGRIRRNDILIVKDGATTGKTSFVDILFPFEKASINEHVFQLRLNSDLAFAPYVFHYLHSSRGQHQILQDFRGATVGGITKEFLNKVLLPLPPLPEQRRIAAILNKADAIRRKRQRAIQLTEEFLRSAFLEMFGDPVTNLRGWELNRLGSIAIQFSDGPFGSNLKTSHYVDSGIRVVRLQNIGVGNFLDEDKAYISEEHFQSLIKHKCVPGDVLIGTLGDPNLRACILPNHIPIALNKADCVQLRPDPNRVKAEYVCWYLNTPAALSLASSMLHGQTRTRISMGQLRELPIPIAPLNLQKKFAECVQRIFSLKTKHQKARAKEDILFNSLTYLAFCGELTTSAAKELLQETAVN